MSSIAPLLAPGQAAEIFGVTTRRIHELVRRGELRCVQISPKDRRFTQEQIDEYITRKSTPEPPRPVDKNASKKIPCSPQRGGGKPGLFGDSLDKAQLRKEMRSWQ